ncbi:MAG: hypothetical protein P8Y69_03650 [Gammaproteobacteria bacterium]
MKGCKPSLTVETGVYVIPLAEYVPGQVWLQEYPIHYAGCDFNARMSVIRISDTELMIHSPCEIDPATKDAISAVGDVACIVAPGSYHYLLVPSAQAAFPNADTYICPGIERKRPDLDFDWFLGDRPPELWMGTLDQVLVRGNRLIWEVAFFHRPSKTLFLVDLIENVTDQTPNVNWVLALWWKAVFRMWNHPKPAPEYQLGWKDRVAAGKSLQKILQWEFEKIVLSHGDLIEADAREAALEAWKGPLSKA